MYLEPAECPISGLSIIIVNYFSEGDILALYGDILRDLTDRDDVEILIVDNSGSLSVNAPTELVDDSRVSIIDKPPGNKGFGRGINMGFEAAQFDKICVINPDIRYNGNVLGDLGRILDEQDSSVGCVTCALTDKEGSSQLSVYNARIPNSVIFFGSVFVRSLPTNLRKLFVVKNKSGNTRPLDPLWTGCSGALFVMRSNVFKKLGGFDPDFFMYCEDTELFRRRFGGRYKLVCCENLCVEHEQGGSDKDGLMPYQNQVSYLLYLRKIGLSYLLCWLAAVLPKYSALVVSSLIFRGAAQEEAFGFFRSWSYLPIVILRGGKFGGLLEPLKIREIRD